MKSTTLASTLGARSSTDLIRQLIITAHKARHASTSSLSHAKKGRAKAEHGQHIYVFHHLQTNQVVYSLTKILQNNAALSQLPFNGKKTVPRALRKDLWCPMATISFPVGNDALGLGIFQRLRELRHLHETQWDPSQMMETVEYEDSSKISKLKPVNQRERGRRLMDQKANSIADMAAALGSIGTGEGLGRGLAGVVSDAVKPLVEVRWKSLPDAEFAESWSDNVLHDQLESSNSRSTPEINEQVSMPESMEAKEAEEVTR